VLFLNIFGLMPFGINVTGNLTITFALACDVLITNLTANKTIGVIFWMPGAKIDAYRISTNEIRFSLSHFH
jgi:F-type H+-transporting ATPase subunit a